MTIKQTLLASLLLTATLLTGCQSNPDANLTDEVVAVFAFEQASSWIYENAQTGALDSTVITSMSMTLELSEGTTGDSPDHNAEVLEVELQHSNLFGQGPKTSSSRLVAYRPSGASVSWMNSTFFNEEILDPLTRKGASRIGLLTSHEVNGRTFSNVIHMVDSADVNVGGVLTHNYYAPGFGLVQKEIPSTGESWNLTASTLNQAQRPR